MFYPKRRSRKHHQGDHVVDTPSFFPHSKIHKSKQGRLTSRGLNQGLFFWIIASIVFPFSAAIVLILLCLRLTL